MVRPQTARSRQNECLLACDRSGVLLLVFWAVAPAQVPHRLFKTSAPSLAVRLPEVQLFRGDAVCSARTRQPPQRGIDRRQRNVSSIWMLRSRLGCQPSLRCAFSMLPTRRGESPGRRGPTVCCTGTPAMCAVSVMT